MMKGNDDDIDLGLVLGNSNQYVQKRLKSDKGAGVNAGSRVDMAFAASDPLSELVWSPHKGLSLKCADSSLSNKNPLLLWNVGSSNLIQYPTESTRSGEGNGNTRSREGNGNKSTGEGNLIVSEVAFHVNGELVEDTGLARSPQSKTSPVYGTSHGKLIESTTKEEMNTAEEMYDVYADRHHNDPEENNLENNLIRNTDGSSDHSAGRGDKRTLNFLPHGIRDSNFGFASSKPLSNKLDDKTSASFSGRIEDVAGGSQILGVGIATASEVHVIKQNETPVSPLQMLPPRQEAEKEVTLANKQESENKTSGHCLISAAPLQKLQPTAENDFFDQVRTEVFRQSEERLRRENSIALKASPTNSRMDLYCRKGKEKALSQGHVLERVSNDDEHSHESVESSNSAGLFAKGRKRWILDEPIAGSKRAKRETEDSPASTSAIRHDSSFMNWISNMVKGYSRVNQDEDPSLALTIAHSDRRQASDQQGIISSKEKCNAGCRNMGFRSMFQSIYCPKMRKPELEASLVEHSRVESNELVLANRTSVQMPRISCPSGKDKSCKKNFISKENVHTPTSRNPVGPSSQLRIMPVNARPMQETNSGGNKASSGEGFHLPKDGVNLSDSFGKRRNSTTENNGPDPLSEGKAMYDKPEGNYNLGSLWITRLSTKTSITTLKLDYGNQNEPGEVDYTDRTRFKDTQITSKIPNDQKTSDSRDDSNEEAVDIPCKDLKTFAENVEASAAYTEAQGHKYQKSLQKLNSTILPSPIFKSSEAMASVFARRLDALKHISPSDVKSDTTSRMKTCLFCGRPGHDLRYCSDTTESDMEALLRNVNSYDSIEGSSCVCLICFQLDHWSSTCPVRSSRRRLKLKQIASSVSDGDVQPNESNEKYSSTLEEKGGHQPLYAANPTFLHSHVDNLMRNVKENPSKRISNSNEVKKCVASNSLEYILKQSQILPICNFVGKQMAGVPKGMFDAIRKLRLSRMEILKVTQNGLRWMNSNVSLSHLDGFFLRIRLGKWEAGLGGTGYYVACITGGPNENSAEDSKNPISVDVGGIRCSVGIQYVSNHDFLEDELMAWWCRTLKNGAKFPSKEDLKSKFEERVKLGF